MPKTFTAAFAQQPKTATAIVTGAQDDLDSTTPTNVVLLATIGAEGAILTRLTAIPRATVTASSLRLWISKTDHTGCVLRSSALMAAHTVEATTAIPVTTFTAFTESAPLRLEAGDKLYVGSAVLLAAGIVFNAEYTEF
jgi:hypothetical protein